MKVCQLQSRQQPKQRHKKEPREHLSVPGYLDRNFDTTKLCCKNHRAGSPAQHN